jgi:hypothetical protein
MCIMANIDSIDKHGGWLVRVATPGSRHLPRDFYVYEPDKDRAVELVKVDPDETVEVLKALNVHELTGFGMKPGEVKQHFTQR